MFINYGHITHVPPRVKLSFRLCVVCRLKKHRGHRSPPQDFRTPQIDTSHHQTPAPAVFFSNFPPAQCQHRQLAAENSFSVNLAPVLIFYIFSFLELPISPRDPIAGNQEKYQGR
jgi:hypothetical protein